MRYSSTTEPGALADTSGYSPDLTFEQKMQLLETVDVRERLELAAKDVLALLLLDASLDVLLDPAAHLHEGKALAL